MERRGAYTLDPIGTGTASSLIVTTLPRTSTRPVNLAVYGVLLVMGSLGVLGTDEPVPRGLAAGLCLAFGVLQALADRRPDVRRLILGGQTAVVAILLTLPSSNVEAFGFLLYVLSVEVALHTTPRVTMGWIAVFWVVYSASALWHEVPDRYVGILFALGVFSFCGLLGHLLRETALARVEGEATLQRLRAAQGRIEELAVMDERRRLARDLHDSVKQHVFAGTMQLGAARAVLRQDPDAARAALDEADASAQKAAAELNLVIQQLRPLDLEEHRLQDALRSHVRDWARRSGLHADVRLEGEPRTLPGLDEALLRVAQEGMANVARHSRAERVEVVLTYRPTQVRLSIRDDGCGFQPARTPGGVGLESMRARVEDLGGRFVLDSAPGAGTSIDIQLEEQ